MPRSRLRAFFVTAFLITITVLSIPNGASASVTTRAERSVTIPVKVVVVGFDKNQVDTSYLTWSGDGKNLPDSIVNFDWSTGNTTGVVFRPQYTFTFASEGFKQSFVSYLHSIETKKEGRNPWFGQYRSDNQNPDYYSSVPLPINYTVYDANAVEDWLWTHGQDLGGFPGNGWTIIVAYLPELPSLTWIDARNFKGTNGQVLPKSQPHYYGISHTDADLGYQYRYRDFMNAWGGHHRMWFVDLSSGPVATSEWVDLPLQVALGDNNIDLTQSFGRTWLTEYIANYVVEATYNFITPDFVYYPQYALNYQIEIFILDDRNATERTEVPIESTVNKDMIAAAFQDLVPYSTVTVDLRFVDVSSQLSDLIKSNYKFTDSWIMGGIFGTPERYGIVDVKPIYKYVLDNLQNFDPQLQKAHGNHYGQFNQQVAQSTMIIPVFAFAFSSETYFTYIYKWLIGRTDWETGALLGIALNEGVFISLSQWDFTRGDQIFPPQHLKGEGFTATIIHEVGHEFGLEHTFSFGDMGNFVVSPMGYFTSDYKFLAVDKDALQRAHVDQLYMETENLLNQISANSDAAGQVRSKLAEAESLYGQMNYSAAIQPVLAAYHLALQIEQSTASAAAQTPILYLVTGIVVGVILGLPFATVLMRREKSKR